jgi:hypothetical protein
VLPGPSAVKASSSRAQEATPPLPRRPSRTCKTDPRVQNAASSKGKTTPEQERLLASQGGGYGAAGGKGAQPLATVDERSRSLYLSFFLMIVVGVGNRIFGKLETYPM